MDFTIQQALIPATDGYAVVDVQIQAGRITAIAPDLAAIGTVVDGRNKLLLPGFVNAHSHSPELWQRGMIAPLPLELWLAELYDFPLLTPEQIYLSALGTAVETLLSGGTTIVDHLILIPGQEIAAIAAAVRAYREIGIRAFVAPLIQDDSFAAGLPTGGTSRAREAFSSSTAAVVDLIHRAVAQFHDPAHGIEIVPAPTGIHLCSDALLSECAAIRDRHDLCLHSHLLETKAQKMVAYEKYGCSAVTHLQQLGFLGRKTSLAHCVWLDDADIEIMAATGTTVVHNPLSNLRLGSGIAPVLRYRAAGVNVTFGCDGSASNDGQDVLEAIKIGSLLHNTTDFDYTQWITPRQAIQMATLGGATGLGMQDQLGSLTVGKLADLVLYDLTQFSLLPRTDPLGLLVLGRPTQVVDSVWVNGDRIVADGKVATVDVPNLRQTLFEQSQWLPERPQITRLQYEPLYRQAMGLEGV